MDDISKEISDEERQKESTENKPQISQGENKEKKICLLKTETNNNNNLNYLENKNRGEINNLLSINNNNITQNLNFSDFFEKKPYFNNINFNCNNNKNNTVHFFGFDKNINNDYINKSTISNDIKDNEFFRNKNEINNLNNNYPINLINVKQIFNKIGRAHV